MSIALGIIGSGTIGTFHAEVAAKTGAKVTLQSSEVHKISKEQFEEGKSGR